MTKPMQTKPKLSDIKPFKRGQEGTHQSCNEQMNKLGANTPCCTCTNHECNPTEDDLRVTSMSPTDWEEQFDKQFIEYKAKRNDMEYLSSINCGKEIKSFIKSLIQKERNRKEQEWESLASKVKGFDRLVQKAVTAERQKVVEEILYMIKNDIGYALREKPMPEVDDVITMIEQLKSTEGKEE